MPVRFSVRSVIAKIAILSIFEALNLDFLSNFSFDKVKNFTKFPHCVHRISFFFSRSCGAEESFLPPGLVSNSLKGEELLSKAIKDQPWTNIWLQPKLFQKLKAEGKLDTTCIYSLDLDFSVALWV